MSTEQFDIFLPFRLPIKILKVMGLWQTKETSRLYRVYGNLMWFVFVFVYTIFMVLYVFHAETIVDIAHYMSVMPTYIGMCFKTANLIFNFEEFQELFAMVEEVMNETKVDDRMKSHLKFVATVFKFFWSPALSTCVLGGFVMYFTHELVYRYWFPFDYQSNEIVFGLVAALQVFDPGCYCGVTIALDCFPIFFMTYILGMLEQLTERLEGIKKRKSIDSDGAINRNPKIDCEAELLNCIKYHRKILKLNAKVKEVFSFVLMIQGLLSTLIFCTTAYALTVITPTENASSFFQLVTYLMSMVPQIFLPCYYGTRIQIESGNISTGLFHSEWFLENAKYRGLVKIFIECTRKPMIFKAVGIFEINLANFNAICNSAYSLFAVFKKA